MERHTRWIISLEPPPQLLSRYHWVTCNSYSSIKIMALRFDFCKVQWKIWFLDCHFCRYRVSLIPKDVSKCNFTILKQRHHCMLKSFEQPKVLMWRLIEFLQHTVICIWFHRAVPSLKANSLNPSWLFFVKNGIQYTVNVTGETLVQNKNFHSIKQGFSQH